MKKRRIVGKWNSYSFLKNLAVTYLNTLLSANVWDKSYPIPGPGPFESKVMSPNQQMWIKTFKVNNALIGKTLLKTKVYFN